MTIHLKGNSRQRRKQRRRVIRDLMSYEILIEEKRGGLIIVRDDEDYKYSSS